MRCTRCWAPDGKHTDDCPDKPKEAPPPAPTQPAATAAPSPGPAEPEKAKEPPKP